MNSKGAKILWIMQEGNTLLIQKNLITLNKFLLL